MHKCFHDDNRRDGHVLKTTWPGYLARNSGEIGADDLFAILEAGEMTVVSAAACKLPRG